MVRRNRGVRARTYDRHTKKNKTYNPYAHQAHEEAWKRYQEQKSQIDLLLRRV